MKTRITSLFLALLLCLNLLPAGAAAAAEPPGTPLTQAHTTPWGGGK